jgi:type II secretion system protein G
LIKIELFCYNIVTNNMFNKPNNKAFTLIEVLVVTAVISLVASVVNAQLGESRKKAEDTHMKQEVNQVRNAVEQYRQDFGSVPVGSSYSSTGQMVSEGTDAYNTSMQELVDNGYLPEVPRSPDGSSYSYLATADEEDAVFAAVLNDEDSGDSNSNSCEVVSSGEWGDCNWNGGIWGTNCEDNAEYDPEVQECFDLGLTNLKNVYCVVDFCGEQSTNPSLYPQSICDDHAKNLSTPPSKICSYDYGYTICEKPVIYVCSGSSNSDYCSCI